MLRKKPKTEFIIQSRGERVVQPTAAKAQNDAPEVLNGGKLRNVVLPADLAAIVARAEKINRPGVATDLSKILIGPEKRQAQGG